eukprot:CAMPEP_0172203830 /NCGR_PEP_ID=MMETSP1050-20130122/31537_1 /TAXON_ID=233186 /ORGANISM="Cryptomonas curvata, Strain CCAP979/52" /LENGTH=85 /DNA_ID=CAMNT_0012882159 /DNA_START=434 /DNA_END=687 /DNA_ORIENTATION=-
MLCGQLLRKVTGDESARISRKFDELRSQPTNFSPSTSKPRRGTIPALSLRAIGGGPDSSAAMQRRSSPAQGTAESEAAGESDGAA